MLYLYTLLQVKNKLSKYRDNRDYKYDTNRKCIYNGKQLKLQSRLKHKHVITRLWTFIILLFEFNILSDFVRFSRLTQIIKVNIWKTYHVLNIYYFDSLLEIFYKIVYCPARITVQPKQNCISSSPGHINNSTTKKTT